jgi:ribulose-phosphate 3-epimerase
MGRQIEVSASILSADFADLIGAVELCEQSGVDRIHIDVMDGHFVPNITIGPVVTQAVRKRTRLLIAAHLMIEHPGDYIEAFAEAGADVIAIHAECYGERRAACRDYGQYPKEVDTIDTEKARHDLLRIKKAGCRPCMVINPGTPECLDGVLDILDSVLVMTVNPGFAGQKFMRGALPKIEDLRRKFQGDIAVDGGINAASAPLAVKAGANVLVTASYFFQSDDPAGTVCSLKALGNGSLA